MSETDEHLFEPGASVPLERSIRASTILGRLTQAVREQNWFAVALEVVIVVVGVVIGFQVTAWGQDRSEQAVADLYLARFADDFRRDLDMLEANIESRETQVHAAQEALAFYEGRSLDVDAFFEAYYTATISRGIVPNRNTMDEVLSSGSLRLIDDLATRDAILDLYVSYESIERIEEHIRDDFKTFIYEPTYSTVPFKYPGPWSDDPSFGPAAEALLANLTVKNGLRLILVNVDLDGLLLDMLRSAQADVERLLILVDTESPGSSIQGTN